MYHSSNLVLDTRAVRIHQNLKCPSCGRQLKPHDVRIDPPIVMVICDGCHHTVLEIELEAETEIEDKTETGDEQ